MNYHNESFGTGYSTIDVECDFIANEITFDNEEYGYCLIIEYANQLSTILPDLFRLVDNKPYKQTKLQINDSFWITIKYEDLKYLINTYDEIESYNHIIFSDEYYVYFVKMISKLINKGE